MRSNDREMNIQMNKDTKNMFISGLKASMMNKINSIPLNNS